MTETVEGKGRCEWKDVTSAIVLFLIWVEHLGHYNVGPIRPFMALYANPIFFLISGFFAASGQKYKLRDFLKKNVKRLLIPYWGWAIINIIFYILQKNIETADEIYYGIWQFIMCDLTKFRYGGTSWFLVGLFVCKMCYELLRRILKKEKLICIVCMGITLLMSVAIINGYPLLNSGYFRGIFWMFFYSLGPFFFPVFDKIHENIGNGWKDAQRQRALHWVSCLVLTILGGVYFLTV